MSRRTPSQGPPRSSAGRSPKKAAAAPWKGATKPACKFKSMTEAPEPPTPATAPRKAARGGKRAAVISPTPPEAEAPPVPLDGLENGSTDGVAVLPDIPAIPVINWAGGQDDGVDWPDEQTGGESVDGESVVDGHDRTESRVTELDEPYPDLAKGLLSDPVVRLEIGVPRRLSETAALAQQYANSLLETVYVVDMANDQPLSMFRPQRPQRPPSRRLRATERDWTVKPIITSPTNAGVNDLLDAIEKARGDLVRLGEFVNTFVGSAGTREGPKGYDKASTYYRMAGRYLHGLIQEALASADDTDAAANGVDLPPS